MSVSVYSKATLSAAQTAQGVDVYSHGGASANYGAIMQSADCGTTNGKTNYGSTDALGNMKIDTADTAAVYSGIADFWNSGGSSPHVGQDSGVTQSDFVQNTTTHEMMHNLGLVDGPDDGLDDAHPIETNDQNHTVIGMKNIGMGSNSKKTAIDRTTTLSAGTATVQGTHIYKLP
ncbi:hypothetical protein ACVWYG_001912 [Pedobacter sp. UYEF25]